MHTVGAETVGDPAPDGQGPVPRQFRQLRRLVLRGVRGQVTRGREFTRGALEDWDWYGHDTAEDVQLVVSELLTNANLHAGGCHELLLAAGEVLRVEVYDGVTTLPRPSTAPKPGVPGGHGLHIVRRLADRWGAGAHEHGKVVWAEFDADRLRTGAPRDV
ncbi:ATP-binding protein [Streptomyces sp. NRRL S-87]|uniref:ATP-binding protein n=1 Tax=Streptomyces sp. NRRL S-87 TaxID=1463920 RepID=UPI00055B1783|nr:ATP-binding protein [Streptomyces sp. NRRL S-87]